ncbi:glycosyltransferase [Kordiimonas gwangyangensis]|uniref:glycosyltransferase n=1 Tax=Kordiimonas gwangyangensis TaxID=288022 RepID=UPI00035D58C6|nr:glycosyltransferase [Kordiimonas gwangyangensis]
MEILVLTPTPSHPQDQGNRKGVYAFTKEFADRGARIHFLYVPTEWYGGFSPREHMAMSDCWDIFHVIPPKEKLGFTPNPDGMDIDCIWYDDIETAVRWWCKGVRMDAVVCHYVFLSKVLEIVPESTFKILYTHDKFSDRHKMLTAQSLKPDYFYTTPEGEGKAFDRADLVVAVKENEAEDFRKLTSTEVVTIGHAGVPTKRDLIAATDGKLRIGFIGSENAVNCTNIDRFFNRFGDEVAARSDWEFIIAGKICDRWSSELTNVKLLGRVGELADFYNQVDVVFIPFEFSTGIKIKAIEAMSFSTPVIMTRDAADGLPVNGALHQCDSQRAVLDGLVALADNREKLQPLTALSEEVYRLIRQEIASKIDTVFTQIRNKRRQTA